MVIEFALQVGSDLGDVWEVSQNAIEVAEKYADGLLAKSEQEAMADTALDVGHLYAAVAASAPTPDEDPNFDSAAVKIGSGAAFASSLAVSAHPNASELSVRIAATFLSYDSDAYYAAAYEDSDEALEVPQVDLNHPHMIARRAERAFQWKLLEDILGETSHKKKIKRKWLRWNDGYIPQLAQEIYDNRDFERMPLLADALEEAGCKDEDILDHCRKHTVHARGCWVVDLLLGKE
ncbi:hypothetical protein HG66A1_62450 [Gimesia chilikensis]|uniref:Uncharacterized protein n=2 Tax=Gimesia chilikensis TaxID=2605989 RepID=A0A517PYG6_9PLAN|nr:hypothetical protein HG66A1_62450 [Gimesia chilikensis]